MMRYEAMRRKKASTSASVQWSNIRHQLWQLENYFPSKARMIPEKQRTPLHVWRRVFAFASTSGFISMHLDSPSCRSIFSQHLPSALFSFYSASLCGAGAPPAINLPPSYPTPHLRLEVTLRDRSQHVGALAQ